MRLFEEGSDFSLSEPTRTTVRVDESTPPETPPPPNALPHARVMSKEENTSSESNTGWKGLAWMFPEKKENTTLPQEVSEYQAPPSVPSHGWAALNWLPGSYAQQERAAPHTPFLLTPHQTPHLPYPNARLRGLLPVYAGEGRDGAYRAVDDR